MKKYLFEAEITFAISHARKSISIAKSIKIGPNTRHFEFITTSTIARIRTLALATRKKARSRRMSFRSCARDLGVSSNRSVSYTHLDVYKRQLGGPHGSENAGMSNERGARNPSAVSLRVPGQG